MSYQFLYECRDGIVEVCLQGQGDAMNLELARRIAADVRAAMQPHPDAAGLMIDVRNMCGRMSIADTFWHLREYATTRRTIRIAVIDLPGNAEYGQFHEDAASNHGLALRYFTEPSEAHAWLKAVDRAD
jgi:hypothetical protein